MLNTDIFLEITATQRDVNNVNMESRSLPAMRDFDHDGWLCTWLILFIKEANFFAWHRTI
jgi:hypothetical protein